MDPCQPKNISAQEFEYFRKCTKYKLLCSACEGTFIEPKLITKCQHVFCKQCIQPHLTSQSCPSCKKHFTSKNVVHAQSVHQQMELLWNKAFIKIFCIPCT